MLDYVKLATGRCFGWQSFWMSDKQLKWNWVHQDNCSITYLFRAEITGNIIVIERRKRLQYLFQGVFNMLSLFKIMLTISYTTAVTESCTPKIF